VHRALFALFLASCASRSTLHAQSDASAPADVVVDAAPETWSREVTGSECSTRPTACVKDDFGPRNTIASVFQTCAAEAPMPCGDLVLEFELDGCLKRISGIVDYSPAFVDCVARTVSANRWLCATADNHIFHMAEACVP
jgi:hypothetical protein